MIALRVESREEATAVCQRIGWKCHPHNETEKKYERGELIRDEGNARLQTLGSIAFLIVAFGAAIIEGLFG